MSTTPQTNFPPQLLAPRLQFISLPPSLTPQQQYQFIETLQQHQLNDIASFQHEYVTLFTKINSDLISLVNTNFADFWSLIQYDKSIIPALHETLANIPSYLPSSTQFLSFVTSKANQQSSSHQQQQQQNDANPLSFDKTSCLLQYFQFISKTSSTPTPESPPPSSSSTTTTKSQTTMIAEQTFRSSEVMHQLNSIYQHLLLVFLRISHPAQSFCNVDQVKSLIPTFNIDQMSTKNPFTSTSGPFVAMASSFQQQQQQQQSTKHITSI